MQVLFLPKWHPDHNAPQLDDLRRKQAIAMAGQARVSVLHMAAPKAPKLQRFGPSTFVTPMLNYLHGLPLLLFFSLPLLAKAQVDPEVRTYIAPVVSLEALRYNDLSVWAEAQGHPDLGLSPMRYGLALAVSNRWFFVNLQININGGVASNENFKVDAAASALQIDLGYPLLRTERSAFGPMIGFRDAHFAFGVKDLRQNGRYMPEFQQPNMVTGLSLTHGGRIAVLAQAGLLFPIGNGSWTNLPQFLQADVLGTVRARSYVTLGAGIRLSKQKVEQDP